MKTVRSLLCFLLSLLLVFNITFAVIGLFIRNRVYSLNYYISKMDSLNFYNSVSTNSIKSLSNLSRITNIPMEVFLPFAEEEWIKRETYNYLTQLFEYLTFKENSLYDINSYEPAQSFDEKLEAYLKANGAILDAAGKKEVEEVRLQAIKIVEGNIKAFDLKHITKAEAVQNFREAISLIYSGIYVYMGTLGLMLSLLLICGKKYCYSILSWYGYAAAAAGMLVLFFSLVPYKLNYMLDMSIIEDGHLRELIVTVMKDGYKYFVNAGITVAAIGAVLTILPYARHLNVKSEEGKV
jgi:hypothetical protein